MNLNLYRLYIVGFFKFFIPISVFFTLTFVSFRSYLTELESEHLLGVSKQMVSLLEEDENINDNQYITSDYVILLLDNHNRIISLNRSTPGLDKLLRYVDVENRVLNTDDYLIYAERFRCGTKSCKLVVAMPKVRINKKINLLLLSSLLSAFVVSVLITAMAVLDARRYVQEHKSYVQRLREVAVYLSHEIKTPLGVILTNLYNINIEEDIRKSIERSIRRIIKLMRNLKILSEMDLESENQIYINIMVLIRDIVEFYKGGLYNKNIILMLDDIKNVEILSDYELIFTLFLNLIDNAVKYSEDCSEVVIKGEIKEGKVVVNITNSVAKIGWKQYKESSYGIGLMIVERIASILGVNVIMKRDEDKSIATVELCCPY